MPYYVPDYNIDPPEDNRKVVSTCEECGEEILQFEEIIYSHSLQLDFCNIDCLKQYLDVTDRYYD